MRNLFGSKLTVLAIAGSIAFSFFILPADTRRAYDSSGSSSQSSSSSTANPYATNQYSTPSTTSTTKNTNTSSTSQSAAPTASQYTPPQNQYGQRQGTNSYPQQTKSNGTNFYGISPEQLSNGPIQDTTHSGPGGGGRGGYDPRWNPNFGTGTGAQVMARESNGLAQSLRDNFPLPISGDEAQMFQVNDFAARSNGGMQSRPR
ncbi:hypothetical protein BH10CYA1_BH10CYA1_03680 [soil metagenome]